MKCPRCDTVFIGPKCPKCGYEPTEYDVAIDTLMQLTGVGRKRAEELYAAGYKDIESIANEREESLQSVHGIGSELAKKLISSAKEIINENKETSEFVTICRVCGAIIPSGADKCPQCGAPVSPPDEQVEEEKSEDAFEKIESMALCPFCGALISSEAKVCPVCGADLRNVPLDTPQPMEDPMEVLKKFFGVTDIPDYREEEENADVRVCPNCGAIVVNKDTCPICGAHVPPPEHVEKKEEEIYISEKLNLCPNCGAIIPADARACPVCGEKLEEEESVEMEVSLGALLKAQPAESIDVSISPTSAELMPEEMDEIALAMQENTPPSTHEKESIEEGIEPAIGPEDMAELIEAVPATAISTAVKEEITSKDLEEIQKSVPSENPPEKVEIEEPISPPIEKKEDLSVVIPSRAEKINSLVYNFGTKEDIISVIPFAVSLLYMASSGFLTGASLTIFSRTVSMLMYFVAFLVGLQFYMSLRRFDKREKILGAGFSVLPLATFLPLPYSIYASILGSGAMLYLRTKKSIDYWLLLSVSALGFAIFPIYASAYSIIFMAVFGVHLIERYEEISVPVPVGDEKMSPEKMVEEGMIAFRNKNYYDAIYLLRRSLKYKERDTGILNTLGLAYGKIGNNEMAMSMFHRVLDIDPKYKYAWNNLGNVHARLGNYDEAMKCYRKALEIDPNYDDALLNMGYVMIRRGNYDEAVRIANKLKAST